MANIFLVIGIVTLLFVQFPRFQNKSAVAAMDQGMLYGLSIMAWFAYVVISYGT
jgi:hypothetical protein